MGRAVTERVVMGRSVMGRVSMERVVMGRSVMGRVSMERVVWELDQYIRLSAIFHILTSFEVIIIVAS
jgi:hypothetical protein